MVELSVSSPCIILAELWLEALTSALFCLIPFCSGDSVRAFLDLTEVNASSDALRLSGSRRSVPSATVMLASDILSADSGAIPC